MPTGRTAPSGAWLDAAGPALQQTASRHIRLHEPSLSHKARGRPWASGASIYDRPTAASGPSLRSPSLRSRAPSDARSPIDPNSPRANLSTLQLQHLLENLQADQYDTFGVEDLRDGFFDAAFYRPVNEHKGELNREPTYGIAAGLRTFFIKRVVNTQREDIGFFFRTIFTTRQGISITRSFLGYFIAYILCVIPRTNEWLGRFSYWIAIAALFNHSGRPFGSQIEGTMGCIVGGALGLAVGYAALGVASSTAVARHGYGGVLAVFLIVLTGVVGWVRCALLRFYQAMMTAGMAIIFLCLVEVNAIAENGTWNRYAVREFAIPWLVGLGICLIVNMTVFPEAGGRGVATALHNAISSALQALVLPREYSLDIHSNMSAQLVNLSEAVRDMRIEVTFTSLRPDDVEQLRNLLQGVIREIMAIKPETTLFGNPSRKSQSTHEPASQHTEQPDVVIDIELSEDSEDSSDDMSSYDNHLEIVHNTMARPAKDLVSAMETALQGCDTVLMDMSGYIHLPEQRGPLDIEETWQQLRRSITQFDDADISLINHPDLPLSYSSHPELVELFLFIHPLRQTADAVDALISKVVKMMSTTRGSKRRLFLPSYPWRRALHRTNPQVYHDRGGLSAGYYFRSKEAIDEVIKKVHARAYTLLPDALNSIKDNERSAVDTDDAVDNKKLRYRAWKALHRLQGWEMRFAFRVVLVIGTLSIPAWLSQSRNWWAESEAWWAVVAAWFMVHPRAGGNAQDLFTRSVATLLGATWGGMSYAAGDASGSGKPYIFALFAAVFMIPAIFRYTSSSHPRSGIMACLSFTVVSLSAYKLDGQYSTIEIAWTRGLALLVGMVTSVVVNLVVWPFVARHELRKSVSSMLLNLGISYRGVVARYIYHDIGYEPTEEDVRKSEIQEARLREGCFRMRELADMTKHEIRLRGPFDAAPYRAAIDACERFLEHIVEVRQASLFFQPFLFRNSEEATHRMMSVRRDAVASILLNLYVLAGALRSKRPVPRYLPSAAVARKRLLDRMAEIEAEHEIERQVRPRPEKSRRWADVYHYAYSAALTDIVAQVELLERLAKAIMGEMALDSPDLIN